MNGGFSHQHISWGDAWAGTGLLNLECDMFKVIVKKSYGGELALLVQCSNCKFGPVVFKTRPYNFPCFVNLN